MFNIDKFVKRCCSILALSQFFKRLIEKKLLSHLAGLTGIVRATFNNLYNLEMWPYEYKNINL